MMSTVWWISQALGVMALAVGFIALLAANDSTHRQANAISAVLDAIHWVLLDANIAALTALLIALRVATAERFIDRSAILRGFFCTVYSAMFVVVAWLTWDDAYSSLPPMSAVGATYAFLFCTGTSLRWLLVWLNIPWIIYSVHTESIAGVLNAMIAMMLLLFTIRRIRSAKLI